MIPTEDGTADIFTTAGKHESTIELYTGTPLSTFVHDGRGRLVSVVDRFGTATQILRDDAGRSYAVVGPDGAVTELHVSDKDVLDEVVYPDGTFYQFLYDEHALMTFEVDPRGNQFEHQYHNGKIAALLDPEGGAWTFGRSTDPAGKVTSSVATAEGNVSLYEETHAAAGEVSVAATSPSGDVSVTSVSADRMVRSSSLACGTSERLEKGYDSEYQVPYPRSILTSLPSGRQRAVEVQRRYEFAENSAVPDVIEEVVALNGNPWTTRRYLGEGAVVTTSPEGRETRLTYDGATLLPLHLEVPGLLGTSYSYDARGRLETVSSGSRTVQLVYDPNGYLDYLVSADGQTYDYSFDIMGRLAGEVRPDGSSVGYQHDANGNVTVVTNPNEIPYGLGYTANNQRSSFTQLLSGAYAYHYDRDRRLQSIVAPSGETILNVYRDGTLYTTTTPEGTTTYEFACGSRLQGATRNGEGVSLGYDGPLVTSDARSGTLSQAIGYGYDDGFRLESITYAGATASVGYDLDGLVTSAGGYAIARNPANGLPEEVSGWGLAQARAFNGYGELDGVASSVAGGEAYAWSVPLRDDAGRIRRRDETLGGTTTSWEYEYYPGGRVKEVRKDGLPVESYTYDDNGNRQTETNLLRGIVGKSYGHTIEDHVLTAGADSVQFDVDGYLQSVAGSEGTRFYEYSSRGELLRVDTPDGTILTYVHDPLGRRIAKEVNGTIVEKYLWADRTTLLALYDGNDNLLQRYAYADARAPVSMTAGGATYFLLTDQVGTLRAVADSSGTIVKRVDYDSFGNIINDSNPGFSVPFGFAGGLHDRDTGLVRFGYRDYSPELGRFVAKDPIDFAGGDTNLYAYVMNDPVNLVDPDGLAACGDYSSCVASCIEKNRWNWDWLTMLNLANTAGNILAGDTGRVGVGGTPPHPTTWEHKVGSKIGGSTGSRVGRFLGRAALLPTIWEGAWDIGTIGRCAAVCAGSEN